MFNLFLKRYQLKVKLGQPEISQNLTRTLVKGTNVIFFVFRVRLVKGGGDL